MDHEPLDTEASYNRVASAYVARIADELAHKPLDRHLLHWFSERIAGQGIVCDVGCGPGHVTHFLHSLGVPIFGLDLSAEMVVQAKSLFPDIRFVQGNMCDLEANDASLTGIVAFYSLIHIPRNEVAAVLREFQRVLLPNGALLLAFHIGHDVVHFDEWWGYAVALDFVFFQIEEMQAYLAAAGFEVEVVVERVPYEGVEYPSRRAYICARKRAGSHVSLNESENNVVPEVGQHDQQV